MSFSSKERIQRKQCVNLKKILFILLCIFFSLMIIIAAIGKKIIYDIEKTTNNVYESVDYSGHNKQTSQLSKHKPFSILLLGIDTGSLGRTEQGRSDTIIVATVNPIKEQSFLMSIPRDTYTNIAGYQTEDKINHAYAFGGVTMSINTVEELLDIPINHYMTINMEGIKTLVDQVGGIDVNNSFDFVYEGTTFKKGKQKLNGELALKYSRMRYDDPHGDYGRQDRQRQILIGIIKKVVGMKTLLNYRSILSTMEKNIKTSLTFDDIKNLTTFYRSAVNNIKTDQMKGEGFMESGISYQRVKSVELQRIQKELKKELHW